MPSPTVITACVLTPPGKGGIAVVLLYGPGAGRVLSSVFVPMKSHRDGGPGLLQLGRLVDSAGVMIDEAVVHAVGASPCADTFEINIHGGPRGVQTVLELLAARGAAIGNTPTAQATPVRARSAVGILPASAVGVPPASCRYCRFSLEQEEEEIGGKMPPALAGGTPTALHDDLEVRHPRWDNPAIGREMLQLLPRAPSMTAAAAIANQWSAGLSERAWRIIHGELSPDAADLRRWAAGADTIRRLTEPAQVVLAGRPNVGKSTLANALAGRQVSLVHEQAGTTRDWVRQLVLLDGVPVWLTDTAGVWDGPLPSGGASAIDAEAVRRAHEQVAQADVVVLLHTAQPADGGVQSPFRKQHEKVTVPLHSVIRVWSKCDVNPPQGRHDVIISAATGQGMGDLSAAIRAAVGLGTNLDLATPMALTQRQADLLESAAVACESGNQTKVVAALHDLLRSTKGVQILARASVVRG